MRLLQLIFLRTTECVFQALLRNTAIRNSEWILIRCTQNKKGTKCVYKSIIQEDGYSITKCLRLLNVISIEVPSNDERLMELLLFVFDKSQTRFWTNKLEVYAKCHGSPVFLRMLIKLYKQSCIKQNCLKRIKVCY